MQTRSIQPLVEPLPNSLIRNTFGSSTPLVDQANDSIEIPKQLSNLQKLAYAQDTKSRLQALSKLEDLSIPEDESQRKVFLKTREEILTALVQDNDPKVQAGVLQIFKNWFSPEHLGKTAKLLKAAGDMLEVLVRIVKILQDDKGTSPAVKQQANATLKQAFNTLPLTPIQKMTYAFKAFGIRKGTSFLVKKED